MGISGIRSKQLRAPYGVSRARWVNVFKLEYFLYNWYTGFSLVGGGGLGGSPMSSMSPFITAVS